MLQAGVLETAPVDIRRDVDRGVEILKAGGCRQVLVLGSVAEGRCDSNSDIDFAVRGCPADQFFKLQGKLLMSLNGPPT